MPLQRVDDLRCNWQWLAGGSLERKENEVVLVVQLTHDIPSRSLNLEITAIDHFMRDHHHH